MNEFLTKLKARTGDVNLGTEKVFFSPQAKRNSLHLPTQDLPVLAEIGISGTKLHKIATGECCTFADGPLGIRFLLKNSFKSRNSSYVVNNFIVQIVAIGKDNTMTKEEIAVKTKVKTIVKEKPKKEQTKVEKDQGVYEL